MTPFHVVIPARHASTRFPGKPLALLAGKPMIRHVWEHGCASGAASIVGGDDDERIATAARGFGAEVALTRADHVSGTERVAEVAAARRWPDDAIVVNLQGDAPLMPAAGLRQVAALLATHPGAAIATLCTRLASPADYRNPNVVKVVMDRDGRALYFSRAPIPFVAHGEERTPDAWRHLGLYAYRAGGLKELARAAPCHLETVEKLEQLRALWLGMEIRVGVATAAHGPDVDTPEDVALVERFLAGQESEA